MSLRSFQPLMKTFKEHLSTSSARTSARKRPLADGECQSSQGQRCMLCHAVDLTYEQEITVKNEALRAYWKQHYSTDILSPLVSSPLGRGYRTVTKRRAFSSRGSVKLGLISPSDDGDYKPFDVVRCAIEPESHASIFQKIQGLLQKPYAQPLSEALNYVIIKGSYTEYTLIMNVGTMSADVVHAMNTLSKSVTHSFKEIVGIFLYEDKSGGRYYLNSSQRQSPSFKKVFGNSEIFQRIFGKAFLYSPLSFSQINMSLVDQFVTTAGELLNLTPQTRLIDLYCGYGLFALSLVTFVSSAIGVEMSTESVQAAIANAHRQRATNVRFIRSDITTESLHRAMKSSRGDDAVLLDPPRNGTDKGVIEYIAVRKPTRVLHIFCNIDIMPDELKRWTENGFTIAKAVPFDMFPGTSSVEMMVLLEHEANRKT